MSAGFDRIVIVDWSGGRDRGSTPKRDAIWAAVAARDPADDEAAVYLRNRAVAEAWLVARIDAGRAAGERMLIGFDFPFGYPGGFAAAVTGREDVFALWDWFAAHVRDTGGGRAPALPGDAGRFGVAGALNRLVGDGNGPFWGNGLARDVDGLPRKGSARTFQWTPPRRATERLAQGAFEVWQMSGAGAVGSQAITGIPVLARLRARCGAALAVAPFETPRLDAAQVVLAEVFPSILRARVRAEAAQYLDEITDATQVRVLSRALAGLPPATLAALLAEGRDAGAEGWILGAGHEATLDAGHAATARVVA